MDNYLEINQQTWDNKVDYHYQSDFYDVASFLEGETSLQSIELEMLPDISGKKILHLQCHFGQDSISLSRLGAKVTGIDFSEKAIEKAKNLADICKTDTQFLVSDVYNLPNLLYEKFDFVFTSYGTIGWLPDLNKWAEVISYFLNPGGQLIFVEFHPFVWMYDDDFTHHKYSYFNQLPIIETEQGTYAEKEAPLVQKSITWNHPLSDVINSLIQNNLEISSLKEFNYSPYSCFKHYQEIEENKYIIPQLGDKAPLVYSVLATKKP